MIKSEWIDVHDRLPADDQIVSARFANRLTSDMRYRSRDQCWRYAYIDVQPMTSVIEWLDEAEELNR